MKKKYKKPAIKALKFAPPKVLFDGSSDEDFFDDDISNHGRANACAHGSKAWFCK